MDENPRARRRQLKITHGQMLYLVHLYRTTFRKLKAEPKQAALDLHPDQFSALEHASWMVNQPDRHWEPTAKAHRWIGFVHGVLWCRGIYTVDELRQHVEMAMSNHHTVARPKRKPPNEPPEGSGLAQ